jgi:asparagine synthase (glutamine-hydrolysing)
VCGIAGILSTRTDREPEKLERQVDAMVAAMLHRGPDQGASASSHLDDCSIVIGARRLAIQDLTDAGSQPMTDPVTGNMLVFNGEVYNFRELGRLVVAAGGELTSGCDTEVVLRGYAIWGPEVVRRLRGMFAFGLWDNDRRMLFLARDRLGVKPLYYSHSNGAFAFASEVRALLQGGIVPPTISQPAIRSYLAFGAVSEPLSIIQGIRPFPPAHYGYVTAKGLDPISYWSLDTAFQGTRPYDSQEDTEQHIESLMRESVKLRLVSDAPTGIFLSGGLDSTVIAALAAQQSTEPIRSVSIVFREREFSEKTWIDRTVSHIGSVHTEVELSDSDFLQLIPTALKSYDQPTVDAINTYVVSMHARQSGLTVALSGIGGDELFGGYPAFRDIPRLRSIRRMAPQALMRPAIALLRQVPGRRDRAKKLSQYLLSDDTDAIDSELVHRELFLSRDRQSLTAIGLTSPVSDMASGHWIPPQLDGFNAVSYSEMSGYLLNMLLRDTDFASMASSLEVREPYLDHELVSAVASLPGSVKSGRVTKPLLRRIAGRTIPASLMQPRKRGFALPMDQWMRGELRHEVEGVLMDRTISYQLAQIVSHDPVERVWSDFVNGETSWTRPWALYVLKSWAGLWAN